MLLIKPSKLIMRKVFKIIQILPIALFALCVLLDSCQKNVFDPEKVKATYEDKFPVKDIDPQMNWKMTKQVAVTISVFEDRNVNYGIRIYDANPLDENSTAKLLAEGTANDKMNFTTTMDCPIALTEAYICRIDPQHRNVVKVASINGNTLNVTFGTNPATRAFTRAENSSITTYTPDRTEAEIASLSGQAQVLTNSSVIKSGEVYKIPEGETFKGRIYTDGISGNFATVIIEGTWDPSETLSSINMGVDLIVTGTGKIMLANATTSNKRLTLIGTSRFIVFAGGAIEGGDNSYIYLSNASGGRYNYNAGTINVGTIQTDETSAALYNCGSLNIGTLQISNSGSKLINQGRSIIKRTSVNATIENGCYLEVTEHMYGNLIMGDNCVASAKEYGSAGDWSKSFKIGSNSMITIEEGAYLNGFTVTGPANGSALIKIGKLEGVQSFTHQSGNVYYEIEEIANSITSQSWVAQYLNALKNTDGTISKWGESPIIIPAGDCTGEGNRPGGGSDTPDTPITYTYVFEDNFPLVGDYDFNDVVLDVTIDYDRNPDNKIIATNINVTLAAAGATKTIGAGLRIVGNTAKAAIGNITFDGPDKDRFQSTLSGSFFGANGVNPESDTTIPLFGSVHSVFGVSSGTMVNTGIGTTAPTYTYQIKIEQNNANQQEEPIITKENLDFFIAYKYRNMNKRMEVHLYEFRSYGSTAAGTTQEANLDLAGNNTWAICVPEFRYPKESINISNQEDDSDCAYPQFLNWTRNRNVNQDWYLYPNENNVYR